MSRYTVFGIVRTQGEAHNLVQQLAGADIEREQISVLFPSEAALEATRLDIETRPADPTQTDTMAPAGAAIGATAGTALFGALGLLVSLGALAIPGIGPILAAGPLLITLGGLGMGAAVGGLTGALVGFGIPEHHARRFESLVKSGHVLVACHCDSSPEQLRATKVFAEVGATDIVSCPEPMKTSAPSVSRAASRERDSSPSSASRR